jgi:hypothetical protein
MSQALSGNEQDVKPSVELLDFLSLKNRPVLFFRTYRPFGGSSVLLTVINLRTEFGRGRHTRPRQANA